MGMAGEGDRGGRAVVGRAWESEVRRRIVGHLNSNTHSYTKEYTIIH